MNISESIDNILSVICEDNHYEDIEHVVNSMKAAELVLDKLQDALDNITPVVHGWHSSLSADLMIKTREDYEYESIMAEKLSDMTGLELIKHLNNKYHNVDNIIFVSSIGERWVARWH